MFAYIAHFADDPALLKATCRNACMGIGNVVRTISPKDGSHHTVVDVLIKLHVGKGFSAEQKILLTVGDGYILFFFACMVYRNELRLHRVDVVNIGNIRGYHVLTNSSKWDLFVARLGSLRKLAHDMQNQTKDDVLRELFIHSRMYSKVETSFNI